MPLEEEINSQRTASLPLYSKSSSHKQRGAKETQELRSLFQLGSGK